MRQKRSCTWKATFICSLAYLINKNTLKESFNRLNGSASAGIDKKTKESYKKNLGGNLNNLVIKLKKGSFRPEKSCHDALKNLSDNIMTKKINYVVDADISGFFDHVNHEWMIKFLKLRISDSKILALIKRFLKAGTIEKGNFKETIEGVPQGGSLSPLLANIYLHYTLDLWFTKVVTKHCKGECYITRYADDSVTCFQYENDAKGYYEDRKSVV